jgi:hypothetical protein
MRRSSILHFAIAVATMLLLAPAAHAINQLVEQRWAVMDRCTAQANAANPENTPQSYAKRDAAMRDCQRRNNVPVRDRLVPQRPQRPETSPLRVPEEAPRQ